ncbi:hypothetical protein LCGC14_2531190 [marine sediment metagenome]|uniref:Uncharacterized protein n=1 Tax=marine sediment metagenome TaxID=412755 RepID=A0A0F9ATY0_9ZZZZ
MVYIKNNYKIESLFYLIKHYILLFFVCKIDSKPVFLSPDFGKTETHRSQLLPGCILSAFHAIAVFIAL